MADNVSLLNASNVPVTIATDEILTGMPGTPHVQRMKRLVGADSVGYDYLDRASSTHAHTAAGSSAAVDVSVQSMGRYTLQVSGVGGVPTAWHVVAEVSLDGVTYTAVLTHASPAQANGVLVTTGPSYVAANFFRTRCVSVTLGPATSISAILVAKP